MQSSSGPPPVGEPRLPRFTGWLRPVVDAVARVNSSIHRKLLFGFLTGAVLLVAMAVLSLLVINKMDDRMEVLNAQATQVNQARQMLYDVTAQSHFRAMELLPYPGDESTPADWNDKVEAAKADFLDVLTTMEDNDPANKAFYERLRSANDAYTAASAKVQAAFLKGGPAAAKPKHLNLEHRASHVLEDLLANCDQPTAANGCFPAMGRPFIDTATEGMTRARDAFQNDKSHFKAIVIAFSALSVVVAMLLGYVFTWAFILPVRKMQGALAGITNGKFDRRVDVPNRDEFGKLTQDLNSTSQRLEALFESQRTLATRLRETNASLTRASEAKSRFLASVSHELRTPMNAILGFTDALLAGVDGPLNEEQTESLGWVQRGGRDLLGLINEILDLSKIEAGKLILDPQPFDPRELVESVVAQHRSLAAQKGISFGWHDEGAPAQVVLDQQRVRQILVNLIGNALKFTGEGQVDVETSTATDGALLVSVRDTGPGIHADNHEAIFEEFRQADGGVTGTGLGLAISRRLARAMGGEVTLESEPGSGCVFDVRLPLDSRASLPPPTSSVSGDTPDGEHLLLSVDDDPSVAPLLHKMLAGNGYRVVASTNAGEAVSDARRLRPAAILLDLLMPERDGGEVLRELKADPETMDIPVIVVSVVDQADLPAVANAQLSKPVNKDALLRALAEHASDGVVP